jgi:hypothetical protein
MAETVKNWAEAFAWVCAGAFFVYKAFSGYLISNLSLSLKCRRRHLAPGTDYLVVTAGLKKGDRGAVSLHDIRAHVSPTVDGELDFKPLIGIKRLRGCAKITSQLWFDGVVPVRERIVRVQSE